MKKAFSIVLVAFATIAAYAYEFSEEREIRYSSASSNCVLDITWPKGVSGFATMVHFHGGGLVGDGKSYAPWPAEAKGRDPIAQIGCRYRVFDGNLEKNRTRPEDCLDDAAAAVAWALDHVAAYGGDPKKVFVSGISAGGYQTAMIGMDPKWLAKYGHRPTDLCGIAPYTGQMTKHFNVRKIGFGDRDPQYAPKVDEWAPMYWCTEKALPPICLVTGGRHDNEFPCRVEENEFLAISLRKCGFRNVEFHETEGSHGGGVEPSAYFVRDFMAKTCDCGMVGAFGEGERAVFVGDSITHGGGFVAYLQLYQDLRHPGSGAYVVNAGISGDRAAGGLRRFDSDIMKLKPDRVFVMFGMNDINRNVWNDANPTEEQSKARQAALTAYADNQRQLADRFAKAGVKTVMITPSPYDQYSNAKSENLVACNDGLAACAEIVRNLATERMLGLIDFHRPLTELQRTHPTTVFCHDRVHPGAAGHLLMAAHVLETMRVSPLVAQVSVDAKSAKAWPRSNKEKKPAVKFAVVDGVRRLPQGGVAFTYAPKALPFPKLPEYDEASKFFPLTERFNQERFIVEGLDVGDYELKFDGEKVGTFSAEEFAVGVNVALLATPNQKRAMAAGELMAELRTLVQLRRREQLVVNMLANAKISPEDSAKADAYLDNWLEQRQSYRSFKSLKGWVDTYRELHPKSDEYAAEEEALRARLAAVRPAISYVTVSKIKGE